MLNEHRVYITKSVSFDVTEKCNAWVTVRKYFIPFTEFRSMMKIDQINRVLVSSKV